MQKTRDSGKCTKVTRNRDARTQFRRTSTHFLEDTTLCGKLSGLWRNGRVVEGGSLENCCAARYRGFKSYFLRQICHRPGNLPGLFSFKRKATEHGTRNHLNTARNSQTKKPSVTLSAAMRNLPSLFIDVTPIFLDLTHALLGALFLLFREQPRQLVGHARDLRPPQRALQLPDLRLQRF